MPIYEYKCQECGKVFDVFYRSVSGSQTLACPSCGRTERCEMPPCSTDERCRRT